MIKRLKEERLKIGDTVRWRLGGLQGTIVIDDYPTGYCVRLDEAIEGGHTCSGRCEDGHGMWILKEALTPVCELTGQMDLFQGLTNLHTRLT